MPFLYFFHPNRTEYYREHGIEGIDWEEDGQIITSYIYGVFALLFVVFFYFKANFFKMVKHDI